MAKPILLLLLVASICTLGLSHNESPFAESIDEENEMKVVPGEIDLTGVIGRRKRSPAGPKFNQENNNNVKNVNNTATMSQLNVNEKIHGPPLLSFPPVAVPFKPKQKSGTNKIGKPEAVRQKRQSDGTGIYQRPKRSPAGAKFNQESNENKKNVNNTPTMIQENINTKIHGHPQFIPLTLPKSPEKTFGRRKRSPAGPTFNQQSNNNVKNVNNTPTMTQANINKKIHGPPPPLPPKLLTKPKKLKNLKLARKRRSPAGPSFNQQSNNNVKNVNNTPSMSQSNVNTKVKKLSDKRQKRAAEDDEGGVFNQESNNNTYNVNNDPDMSQENENSITLIETEEESESESDEPTTVKDTEATTVPPTTTTPEPTTSEPTTPEPTTPKPTTPEPTTPEPTTPEPTTPEPTTPEPTTPEPTTPEPTTTAKPVETTTLEATTAKPDETTTVEATTAKPVEPTTEKDTKSEPQQHPIDEALDLQKHIESVVHSRVKRSPDDDAPSFNQQSNNNLNNTNNAPSMKQENVNTHVGTTDKKPKKPIKEKKSGKNKKKRVKRSPDDDAPSFNQQSNNNKDNKNNAPSMKQENVKTHVGTTDKKPKKPIKGKKTGEKKTKKQVKVKRRQQKTEVLPPVTPRHG